MHPEKNTIFFVGDTHGRFRNLRKAVRQHKPAAIILLGDVQPRTPLNALRGPLPAKWTR